MTCTCYSKGEIIKIYASTLPLIFPSYSSSFEENRFNLRSYLNCSEHSQSFFLLQQQQK